MTPVTMTPVTTSEKTTPAIPRRANNLQLKRRRPGPDPGADRLRTESRGREVAMPRRIDPTELRELADWRPGLGVVTVCLATEPGDRRESWRAVLRDGLKSLVDEA